jgi:hypothetical protein
MKKLLVLLMSFVFIIAACNDNKTAKNQNPNNRDKDDYGKTDNTNNTNNADENKTTDNFGNSSWTETDKNKFLKECAASFDESQGDLPNKICPCVLQKMEKEFTSYSEADSKGGEAAGQRIALQCKDEIVGKTDNTNTHVAGGWPQVEKTAFITNCVTNATAGGKISRTVAQNYCDCMLNKMETLYPDIQDAGKLTEEEMNSPAMVKMAKDCLSDN